MVAPGFRMVIAHLLRVQCHLQHTAYENARQQVTSLSVSIKKTGHRGD